jgi:predicted Zn-dependent protease
MRYENPEIPEGINDSERRPLLSFVSLSAAALALVVFAGALLFFLADRLIPLLPFRYEISAAGAVFPRGAGDPVIEPYLQGLAGRLAAAQGLPADMRVQVHYDQRPVVNAFATLGGHVVLYQGLLETMPSENALAMVLAHEVAHVRHRHPIASLGRSAAFGFAMMLLGADSGSQSVVSAISQGGTLTMLSFSRSQEEAADVTALGSVASVYGHVGGADGFFHHILKRAGEREPPRFLSSHPLTSRRIEALGALAVRQGWKSEGELTPLPPRVGTEIERHRKKP